VPDNPLSAAASMKARCCCSRSGASAAETIRTRSMPRRPRTTASRSSYAAGGRQRRPGSWGARSGERASRVCAITGGGQTGGRQRPAQAAGGAGDGVGDIGGGHLACLLVLRGLLITCSAG